jgi:hypothetical protein
VLYNLSRFFEYTFHTADMEEEVPGPVLKNGVET